MKRIILLWTLPIAYILIIANLWTFEEKTDDQPFRWKGERYAFTELSDDSISHRTDDRYKIWLR